MLNESEAKLQNTQRARERCATSLPILDLSTTPPQLPQLQSQTVPGTVNLAWVRAHMRTRREARMCSSSLQIKFADKLHLPLLYLFLFHYHPTSSPRLSPISLYSFSIFHYNFHSKHLRDWTQFSWSKTKEKIARQFAALRFSLAWVGLGSVGGWLWFWLRGVWNLGFWVWFSSVDSWQHCGCDNVHHITTGYLSWLTGWLPG